MRGDLNWIADNLDREAKYWKEHPDYFTPNRAVFATWPHKAAYDHIKTWLSEHAHQQRATHTDIVLRDMAAMIRKIALDMSEQEA